jgi:hypothetical protein
MYLVHLIGMQQQTDNIVISKTGYEELDEFAFNEWKNELQPNLTTFWSTMNQT